jgi:hypothetical protein
MSRPTVVRRLTAVIALLAVLCLALPAVAAPGAQGQSHRTRAVHAPSLVDQLVAWIGSFLPGQTVSHSRTSPAEKAGAYTAPGGTNSLAPTRASEADRGGMVDPNG